MTDVKHTPGPWSVSCIRLTAAPLFGPDIRLLEVGPSEDRLALVYFDMKTGLGQADAHLIAAAPELLVALKSEVRNCPSCKGEGKLFEIWAYDDPSELVSCSRCAPSRAAIAKAEGQS